VRKIDLEEKILQLEKDLLPQVADNCSLITSELPKTAVEVFGAIMEGFFDNQFNPADSIKPYFLKAKKIMNSFKNGKYSIESLEDLVKIFISFLRCQWASWSDHSKRRTVFEFEVTTKDAQMLEDFRKQSSFVWYKYTEGLIKKRTGTFTFNQCSIDYIYIVTVIIYHRLMQFEGEYYEEDNQS